MLWVHINNQGVADCKVNVGNKIRQGDSIPLFVVIDGMAENATSGADTSAWFLPQSQSDVAVDQIQYLKPGASEFVNAGIPYKVRKYEFSLGNSAMANSYFINHQSYYGYYADIPDDATTFSGNGGHVTLKIIVLSRAGSTFNHAENITIYVEPTYGKLPTKITESDYHTLISLIQSKTLPSQFQLSAAPYVNDDDSVDADTGERKNLVYAWQNLGWLLGTFSVPDASALIGKENDGNYRLLCFEASNFIQLAQSPSMILGNCVTSDGSKADCDLKVIPYNDDGTGVAICMRLPDGWEENKKSFSITFFGSCPISATKLKFDNGDIDNTATFKDITATYTPLNSDQTASVTTTYDEENQRLVFHFFVPNVKYQKPSLDLNYEQDKNSLELVFDPGGMVNE